MQDKEISSSMHDKQASLSVIVVTVYSTDYLTCCLTALMQQVDVIDIEIIVVCDERISGTTSVGTQFPNVKFHIVSGQQSHEKLRAAGVRQATGKIVAITVDHCTPDKHWCAQILKTHEGPYAAVGGAVEKGTQSGTAVNWAVHLYDYCNYGYYLNPVKHGSAYDLSDCNVAYKHEVLEATGDLWEDEFNVPLFNRALVDHGKILWMSPEIMVYQNRSIDLRRAATIAFRRGRVFATKRAASSSFGQRLFYMVFSPFLPGIFFKRMVFNMIPKKGYFNAVLKAFPFIVLLALLWSLGEFVGYCSKANKGYSYID